MPLNIDTQPILEKYRQILTEIIKRLPNIDPYDYSASSAIKQHINANKLALNSAFGAYPNNSEALKKNQNTNSIQLTKNWTELHKMQSSEYVNKCPNRFITISLLIDEPDSSQIIINTYFEATVHYEEYDLDPQKESLITIPVTKSLDLSSFKNHIELDRAVFHELMQHNDLLNEFASITTNATTLEMPLLTKAFPKDIVDIKMFGSFIQTLVQQQII